MKRGRPPSKEPLVSLHLRLPQSLRDSIDSVLAKFYKGTVPLGAISEFICNSLHAGLVSMQHYFNFVKEENGNKANNRRSKRNLREREVK